MSIDGGGSRSVARMRSPSSIEMVSSSDPGDEHAGALLLLTANFVILGTPHGLSCTLYLPAMRKALHTLGMFKDIISHQSKAYVTQIEAISKPPWQHPVDSQQSLMPAYRLLQELIPLYSP